MTRGNGIRYDFYLIKNLSFNKFQYMFSGCLCSSWRSFIAHHTSLLWKWFVSVRVKQLQLLDWRFRRSAKRINHHTPACMFHTQTLILIFSYIVNVSSQSTFNYIVDSMCCQFFANENEDERRNRVDYTFPEEKRDEKKPSLHFFL